MLAKMLFLFMFTPVVEQAIWIFNPCIVEFIISLDEHWIYLFINFIIWNSMDYYFIIPTKYINSDVIQFFSFFNLVDQCWSINSIKI